MLTSYVPKTPFSEIAHPLARGRSAVIPTLGHDSRTALIRQERGSMLGSSSAPWYEILVRNHMRLSGVTMYSSSAVYGSHLGGAYKKVPRWDIASRIAARISHPPCHGINHEKKRRRPSYCFYQTTK